MSYSATASPGTCSSPPSASPARASPGAVPRRVAGAGVAWCGWIWVLAGPGKAAARLFRAISWRLGKPGGGAARLLGKGSGIAVGLTREVLFGYSLKGLKRSSPVRAKSLMLRVTTVMPCTRAVAAISASITGRGRAYC